MSSNDDEFSDIASNEIHEVFIPEDYYLSEEPSMSQWSSLEFFKHELNIEVYKGEVSDPEKVCLDYISGSDSSVYRHVYYKYPSVLDPGIDEALFKKAPKTTYPPDGQELYLTLCKKYDQCPVRMFHRSLLTNEINLRYYGINPQNVRTMTMALEFNKHVRIIDLTENHLTTDACYHLGNMLQYNNTLTDLILSGCKMRWQGFDCIANGLKINNTLKLLDISFNELEEKGGELFSAYITEGLTVPQINVSGNSLGIKTADSLSASISIHKTLTHLNLSWNNFYHAPSLNRFIDTLAYCSKLVELNLSWNALEGVKVASVIQIVMQSCIVKKLILSNNLLKGEEVVEILAKGLFYATKLEEFDLSNNPLSPNDALILLKRMLYPKVKLQKLIMANVSVQPQFLDCIKKINTMKSRKNFTIEYGEVVQNWTVKGPDPRTLVLKRIEYLGKKDKKKMVDILTYFLTLNKTFDGTIMMNDFQEHLKMDGIFIDEDLMKEIFNLFPGRDGGKSKPLDLWSLSDYILRLWPEKKLPPTPPLQPEPEPEPTPKKKKK